jgi:hypothetical protein
MALTTYHHVALRLKKEYSYTSTPLLGLCGLFYGELYLYLYLYMFKHVPVPVKQLLGHLIFTHK